MRDTSTPVARFADALLARDLPGLDAARRRDTVAFIGRRVAVLPSVTRFGVTVIAASVGLAARLVGTERVVSVMSASTLPLLGEYPRLVRSLGYAFVWETWPSTRPDGSPS